MSLWREAYGHSGHLSDGLCPDEDDLARRDPHCFYCSVMDFIEMTRPKLCGKRYGETCGTCVDSCEEPERVRAVA